MSKRHYRPWWAVPHACVVSCVVVALAAALEGTVFVCCPSVIFPSAMQLVVSCDLAGYGTLAACTFSCPQYSQRIADKHALVVYDLTKGSAETQLLPLQTVAKCVAGNPLHREVYVATWDGFVYCLDYSTGRVKCRALGRHADLFVVGLRISPDGRVVVSYGEKFVVAWNTESGQMLWQQAVSATAITFAQRVPRLFCGLYNGQVVELDLTTGRTLAIIPAQDSPVISVVANPSGDCVTSVGEFGRLAVSNVASQRVIWSCSCSTTDAIIVSDGKLVVSADNSDRENMLVLRDISSGKHVASFTMNPRVSRFRYADNSAFIAWGWRGPVRILRIELNDNRWSLVPAQALSAPRVRG